MFRQWGYTFPVSVFMLGACSVYNPSLLATNPIVEGGAGGVAGGLLSGAGGAMGGVPASGGRDPESDAGAAGSGETAGANAGSGGASGGASGSAGTGGNSLGGVAGSVTAGHGGGGAAGGSAGAPVVLALETIDTMEDHDGAIDNTAGRNGDWYAGHDATATGVQTPGSTFTMTALPTTDTRYKPTDQWASMTKGMGFNDWGEDLGFNMMLVPVGETKHPPYDATPYCGVHFFGRVGVGASSTVIVRVPDKNSLPDGGVCSVTPGPMPCYAYFQKVYSFNTTWTEYNVLFSDLKGTGWPKALAQNAIFSLEFGLANKSVFELWIDDVSFLKKPASGVCPTVYP